MSAIPVITLLTLIPLVAGLGILVGRPGAVLARRVAVGAAGLVLLGALALWAGFDPGMAGMQHAERHAWVPALGIEYALGIDGISLVLVTLTALLVPFALLAGGVMKDRPRLYLALVLFLEGGLIGTFTALNFFHWFLFWELSLIPAFFLVKLWGGADRSAAAIQFFVYTMVGSITMLLGFLALYLATGSFDFLVLAELGRQGRLGELLAVKIPWAGIEARELGLLVFLGVFLGFAVKIPAIPFHTWLPAAYATAPTPVTMLLTGAMSKMGVYGLVRILLPIFGEQMRSVMPILLLMALATIVLSAWSAFAQTDLKRMFAYSSVNHLGYCLLGVFLAARITPATAHLEADRAAVLNGVVLQMFNHGVIAATLFCLVGWLEERSGGLRCMGDFRGLRRVAPVYCGLTGVATFASLGLPGLSGFVGEFLIFKGAFALSPWSAALAVPGLLITALFLLTFLHRVFHGPLEERWRAFPDLTRQERWLLAVPVGVIFLLGVVPQVMLRVVNPTVTRLVEGLVP